MPQLLDACARGGAVEEALDLRAFVARAALLHPDLQARQRLTLHARQSQDQYVVCRRDPRLFNEPLRAA